MNIWTYSEFIICKTIHRSIQNILWADFSMLNHKLTVRGFWCFFFFYLLPMINTKFLQLCEYSNVWRCKCVLPMCICIVILICAICGYTRHTSIHLVNVKWDTTGGFTWYWNKNISTTEQKCRILNDPARNLFWFESAIWFACARCESDTHTHTHKCDCSISMAFHVM